MSLSLSFLGGVSTVTGSRFLLEHQGRRILVDCGLFQGLKQLRLRNWAHFPVEPASIEAVLLTHAHIDHSGYLPALVRDGFSGRIHTSHATMELCRILLPDSGFLQEKDAEFANRHRFSKHKPALPLYTAKDAEAVLPHIDPVPFHQNLVLQAGLSVRLRRAGHILGAASIECGWAGKKVVFSGDLGRLNDPMMVDPEPVPEADYLVVESTYGNRLHDRQDVQEALAEIVSHTIGRGGTVIIPAFAVGRAQTLLYHLEQLISSGRLPKVPVFLDSPMAINASGLLCSHLDDHRLSAGECRGACDIAEYVRDVEASKALTANPTPKVIISASGMATGGRVLHHLKRYAPDPRNAILFSGFQAAGTRGAAMTAGVDKIKIHGEYFPVRAEVGNLAMLSAHADADEIMAWLKKFEKPPRTTFISHGEPIASDELRKRIEEELGWSCHVPEHLEKVELA
ncbi:MBL fold metallo-hydrolase RNA specificity domain-containing protein [Chelativorans alearense]|uniref:MBL fold metallo-hydrolase RNA specificity domain-containing protein n=1 Tax=Chelativorans alearense TaxID=2681495 RepID=UPI0013D70C31|nr:MBL fold metallo-hydrolase [Chelativorans alearense]